MADGWKCPGCGATWAPHVDECRRCNAAAPTEGERTFAQLWELYEKGRGPDLSAWRTTYRVHGMHLLLHFGALRVPAELTRESVDDYVRKRREQNVLSVKRADKQRRVSITTIGHEVKTLKACINWCMIERRLLTVNPIAGYKIRVIVEDLATVQDRRFFLPEDGLVKLLAALSPQTGRMLILAYETGMRSTEFRALEWPEVDLDRGIIDLPAWRTKARRARAVPLSRYAVNVLRVQKAISAGCKYVFPTAYSHEDRPTSQGALYQQFRKARETAGIKGPKNQEVWIHQLRKSFGSLNALGSALPPRLLMEIMGHETEEAHGEYIALGEQHLQSAREALDARQRDPKLLDILRRK